MEDLPDDGMVLIMGKSGAGKSYLINQLKRGSVTEGHSLSSETSKCQAVLLELEDGKTITVVDTPGFYDTERSDGEILNEIAEFIAAQDAIGIPLRGILYLYHILDTRAPLDYASHIRMFESLVGKAALENVTLVTTMWNRVNDSHAAQAFMHEQELLDKFWASMVAGGACVCQFDGSADGALALILQHVGKRAVALEMNKEMNEGGKDVLGTTAGQVVHQELRNKHSELNRLQAQVDEQVGRGDLAGATATREKEAALRLTVTRLAESSAKMKDKRPGFRVRERIDAYGKKLQSGSGEVTRTVITVLGAVLGITFQIVQVVAGA